MLKHSRYWKPSREGRAMPGVNLKCDINKTELDRDWCGEDELGSLAHITRQRQDLGAEVGHQCELVGKRCGSA